MTAAEPHPGVVNDEWILSQVVFDDDGDVPLPPAVLQIEDGPPRAEDVVPPNQEVRSISTTLPFEAVQANDEDLRQSCQTQSDRPWSLTWDQVDQIIGMGIQGTPANLCQIVAEVGNPMEIAGLDFASLYEADWSAPISQSGIPEFSAISQFPHEVFDNPGNLDEDPIEDFPDVNESMHAGIFTSTFGNPAIEDRNQPFSQQPSMCGPHSAGLHPIHDGLGSALDGLLHGPRTRAESGPIVIDVEETQDSHISIASGQEDLADGRIPLNPMDIPFHQPPIKGVADDETVPGNPDEDLHGLSAERRTVSLPPSRVSKILSPKLDVPVPHLDLAQPELSGRIETGSHLCDMELDSRSLRISGEA